MSDPPHLTSWPPCWTPEQANRAITSLAKVDAARSHYVLACHAPIRRIRDDRNPEDELTEDELYRRLRDRRDEDILAFIHGQAGTGKSHLICWLKLRFDYALESKELSGLRAVLIQRNNGTLKNALEQLIGQLGGEFEEYLTPVRTALANISQQTARQKLLYELALEVGPRWQDRRGRESPLPPSLQQLSAACAAPGFGRWLLRPGGVIDRRVGEWIRPGAAAGPASSGCFTDHDLLPTEDYCGSDDNPGSVLTLLEELRPPNNELRSQAIAALNQALRHAAEETVGLSGSNLRGVFEQIRRDLRGQGERLALFIEDASAMQELDEEIVNAVEPSNQADLCSLLAVLGLTDVGMRRLRENQRQRAGLIVDIGDDLVSAWGEDREQLAAFTARYLNAARLDEDTVKAIAADRQNGARDVTRSRCTACPVREPCHARFGAVTVDQGVTIGLFPLTPPAPGQLLRRLRESEQSDIRRNQRGLLEHLLRPLLQDPETLGAGAFPRPGSLPIEREGWVEWSAFADQYCGAWEEDDRARLRLLAEVWIDEPASLEDGARTLEPLLAPLAFPPFTQAVAPGDGTPPDTPPAAGHTGERDRTGRLLEQIRAWIDDGEDLASRQRLREWLGRLVRHGIPWDDEPQPPLSEWKRLRLDGGEGDDAYGCILLPQPGGTPPPGFHVPFPRDRETADLLDALVLFTQHGKQSWQFEHGERHSRRVRRWLATHQAEVLGTTGPGHALDTGVPVGAAVALLAAGALLYRRCPLSEAPDERFEQVLAAPAAAAPCTLSPRLGALVLAFRERHGELRDFLLHELAVPQGRSAERRFINPLPVLRAVERFLADLQVPDVAEGYAQGFWKPRYHALRNWTAFTGLPGMLQEERAAVQQQVQAALAVLTGAGYDVSRPSAALRAWCRDVTTLAQAKARAAVGAPDPAFDALVQGGVLTTAANEWGQALEGAAALVREMGLLSVLLFDPAPLKAAAEALRTASTHLSKLRQSVQLQEQAATESGDASALKDALLTNLSAIVGMRRTQP
jgi:hypothetical protein